MAKPNGSNQSMGGLVGAPIPNLPQIPNLAAFPSLQGLIAAGGLRHQLNNPHLRQSVSVEPSSRESNSSAEDSGQFSPSESKKPSCIDPLQSLKNLQAATTAAAAAPPPPVDVNQNFAKALANLPPTLQSKLGPYMEESMKMLSQKMVLQRMEAEKRKRQAESSFE